MQCLRRPLTQYVDFINCVIYSPHAHLIFQEYHRLGTTVFNNDDNINSTFIYIAPFKNRCHKVPHKRIRKTKETKHQTIQANKQLKHETKEKLRKKQARTNGFLAAS